MRYKENKGRMSENGKGDGKIGTERETVKRKIDKSAKQR